MQLNKEKHPNLRKVIGMMSYSGGHTADPDLIFDNPEWTEAKLLQFEQALVEANLTEEECEMMAFPDMENFDEWMNSRNLMEVSNFMSDYYDNAHPQDE